MAKLFFGILMILWMLTACQRAIPHPAAAVADAPTPTNSADAATILTTPVLALTHDITSHPQLLVELPTLNGMLWQINRFAWSPSGDAIAYIETDRALDALTGTLQVSAAPGFAAPQALASNAIGDPTWSPDGAQIAFVALRPNDALGTVMIVNANGSDLRDALPRDTASTDPGMGYKSIEAWPDENNLVIVTNCGSGCLHPMTLRLDRTMLTPLLVSNQQGMRYNWSPDRKFVVVANGARPQIGIIAVGSEEVTWIHDAASDWTFFADWAPDSSQFLFLKQTENAAGMSELWMWDIAASQGRLLLPGVLSAQWAPQGGEIAFVTLGQPYFNPNGATGAVWEGVTATQQGPNPLGIGFYQLERKIGAYLPIGEAAFGYNNVMETSIAFAPVWSADGKHLAYLDATRQAWIVCIEDRTYYQVYTQNLPADEVKWSPDGEKLAIRTGERLLIFSVQTP